MADLTGYLLNQDGDAIAGEINVPVMIAAVLSGGTLTVSYSVPSSIANSAYPLAIEIFAADVDNQEGQRYLGGESYPAPGADTVAMSVSGVSAGQRIVATATDASGNTSEFSASVVIAAALLAPGMAEGGPSLAALDAAALTPLVTQAVAAWESAGLDAARVAVLQSLSFEIADLPGRYLGLATPDHIVLDLDAAGYGWYLEKDDGQKTKCPICPSLPTTPNPALNSQLSTLNSQLSMDLLTAVVHEMGHVLGLADLGDGDDLMAGVLQPGTRHLPTTAYIDLILAGGDW